MSKKARVKRISHSMAGALVLLWMGTQGSLLSALGQNDSENELEQVLIDPHLELEVRKALSEDRTVESSEITVVVEQSEVFLYGAVDSEREKERAEKVASQVEGVASVSNQITVEPARSLTDMQDAEIATGIREALNELLGSHADDIEIAVDQGTATLEGAVENRSQLRRAVETALASGAVLVKNRLRVREEETRKPI